jgi:hypothetical protein
MSTEVETVHAQDCPGAELCTEALIHDLAIVLGGCLHPSAGLGPAPRLAANRIRDVLGITPGELTAGIEDRLTAALGLERS